METLDKEESKELSADSLTSFLGCLDTEVPVTQTSNQKPVLINIEDIFGNVDKLTTELEKKKH